MPLEIGGDSRLKTVRGSANIPSSSDAGRVLPVDDRPARAICAGCRHTTSRAGVSTPMSVDHVRFGRCRRQDEIEVAE